MNTRVMTLSKAEDDSHLPTLLTRHYTYLRAFAFRPARCSRHMVRCRCPSENSRGLALGIHALLCACCRATRDSLNERHMCRACGGFGRWRGGGDACVGAHIVTICMRPYHHPHLFGRVQVSQQVRYALQKRAKDFYMVIDDVSLVLPPPPCRRARGRY
jgi:hypothetical protein